MKYICLDCKSGNIETFINESYYHMFTVRCNNCNKELDYKSENEYVGLVVDSEHKFISDDTRDKLIEMIKFGNNIKTWSHEKAKQFLIDVSLIK